MPLSNLVAQQRLQENSKFCYDNYIQLKIEQHMIKDIVTNDQTIDHIVNETSRKGEICA